jgi:hypothetical protein
MNNLKNCPVYAENGLLNSLLWYSSIQILTVPIFILYRFAWMKREEKYLITGKRRSMDVCRELEKTILLGNVSRKAKSTKIKYSNLLIIRLDIKTDTSAGNHLPKYHKFEGEQCTKTQ